MPKPEILISPNRDQEHHKPITEHVPPSADLDIVSIYLKDLEQYPRISREEELALAQQIEASKKELLHVSESDPYYAQVQEEMQRAKRQLIEANLRLVVSAAQKHMGRGLPFQELIQEGNLALMNAAEYYDWTRGTRFSTYATTCIKRQIKSALSENRVIPINRDGQRVMREFSQTWNLLAQDHGAEPTQQQVIRAMGSSSKDIHHILATASPLSLDKTIGNDSDGKTITLAETIADHSTDTEQTPYTYTQEQPQLPQRIEELNPRHRAILEYRFGIGYGREHSLEETGREFGISRERARQVIEKALELLKGDTQSKPVEKHTTTRQKSWTQDSQLTETVKQYRSQNYSIPEIARATGKSVSHIKNLCSRLGRTGQIAKRKPGRYQERIAG